MAGHETVTQADYERSELNRFWVQAYLASLSGGGNNRVAKSQADQATVDYRDRLDVVRANNHELSAA